MWGDEVEKVYDGVGDFFVDNASGSRDVLSEERQQSGEISSWCQGSIW